MKLYFDHVNSEKLPTILVLKSYDPATNTTLSAVETTKYDKKDYKINELADFLDPFGRATKKILAETSTSN